MKNFVKESTNWFLRFVGLKNLPPEHVPIVGKIFEKAMSLIGGKYQMGAL